MQLVILAKKVGHGLKTATCTVFNCNTARQIADAIKHAGKTTWKWVKKNGEAMKEGIKQGGKWTIYSVKKVGHWVVEACKEGSKKTYRAFKATGSAIKHAAVSTASGVKEAGQWSWKAVKHAAHVTVHVTVTGVKHTGKAIGSGLVKAGKAMGGEGLLQINHR